MQLHILFVIVIAIYVDIVHREGIACRYSYVQLVVQVRLMWVQIIRTNTIANTLVKTASI